MASQSQLIYQWYITAHHWPSVGDDMLLIGGKELLMSDETTTLEITVLEARALRAAILWAQTANIDLYEYQTEAFENLMLKLEKI